MRVAEMRPEFVASMPEDLTPGVIYISTRFRTAAHLCACGCGSRVVTPIRPAAWAFTYDGETVSLWPSIGNWQKPCRSHYVIRRSRVEWARSWSESQVARGRARDKADLAEYYKSRAEWPQPMDARPASTSERRETRKPGAGDDER